MNLVKWEFFIFIFTYSCTQINPTEQKVYQDKKLRHGIVPYSEINLVKNKLTVRIDKESIGRGKVLYTQHCSSCHGDRGMGNGISSKLAGPPYPVDLRKTVNEVENFDFFISVSSWKGQMPGWKALLSDEERHDIANYLKTFRQ